MDVDEKPVAVGYSPVYVRILLGMLCLGVLRANENKPSGGSTETQCGDQQQHDDQTILRWKHPYFSAYVWSLDKTHEFSTATACFKGLRQASWFYKQSVP